MKNLQIGDNDLTGNKFNGHDLHIYLNKIGIESNHLTSNPPQSKDKKTFQIGTEYSREIRDKMLGIDKYYNLIAGNNNTLFDIINNKLFLESDVVHMHLVHNNILNVNLLPLMTSLKPVVWTMHDPFAATGHCIHPFNCTKWKNGCGDCPDLKIPFKISKDSTALNWEMKRIAFQNSQLTLIVSSKWMQNIVKQSPLLKHFDTHLVPFGINHDLFKPAPIKLAKEKLNIKEESITLLFRMQKNDFKGADLLLEALPKLKSKHKLTLISVGEKGLLNHLKRQFKILEFGWVSDDKKLIELYQACDIFLMPSKVETFGMMAIEAMSCKKPVVVLKGTALPEVTAAPEIGVECERNAQSLQKEIQNLIDNSIEREHRAELGYKYALREYGSEAYVKKIVEVYKHAITNHKPSLYKDNVIKQLLKYQPIQIKKPDVFPVKMLYILGLIPIKIQSLANSLSINIGSKSIRLLRKKTTNNNVKYYFFGILILRIKHKLK